MKRIHVLVEGQTEETLMRDVLAPHLRGRGIDATTVILKTKRVKAGGAFRGGVTSASQVLGDIRRLLGDTSAAAVTTMVDYYGLPDDFPGMSSRPSGDPYRRVLHVENALGIAVGDRRFVPHLTLHELEAWVFVDPQSCQWLFDDQTVAEKLARIRDAAGGPELINEGPHTSPAKRLKAIYPAYQKVLHGPMIVRHVGLPTIWASCPHAAAWVQSLESL